MPGVKLEPFRLYKAPKESKSSQIEQESAAACTVGDRQRNKFASAFPPKRKAV
jgi:hypothetical protein